MATAEPADVIRYVGPGIEEALASLLGHWSRFRKRLQAKRHGKAPPSGKPSEPAKEQERD